MAWNLNEKTIEPVHENGHTLLFRAKEQDTGFIRYFKALRPGLDYNPLQQRLLQEYEQAKRLAAADVWVPEQAYEWNGAPALLFQPIEGQPLSAYLQSGPAELTLFLNLAIGAAEAVSKLHQTKHLHLNLSPYAFFVESNRKKCKLTDLFRVTPISTVPEAHVLPQPVYETNALFYAAPELTGRMNRRPDHRTDLYALGIMFYRMLSGELPFQSDDVLELLHMQFAKEPKPLTEYQIPKPVSDIVLKCLAKHPEHRYPSAFALRHDLEIALNKLLTDGYLEPYEIGNEGVSDQFVISEKIYGREAALQALSEAYARVRKGGMEFAFVSGISGIGKSYLIHEFQKLIQQQNGLFIYGKFDQFKRATPYHALHEAGKQLLQYLLTLNEEAFHNMKRRILEAVGPNGQVLMEMIPDLEQVFGKQPPITKMPPAEMYNRLMMTVQKVLSVFTSREQPLILFLDDLQWADAASIQLIQDIGLGTNRNYRLFIGSFRDRDVGGSHPLRVMIDKLQQQKSSHTTQIQLEPLDERHLEQMLTDTLQPARQPVRALAQLMMKKTKGNPFFTKQFFRSIYDQQLLWFDYSARAWTWDEAKIQELHMTENVVDFMINKIVRLPEQLQSLLQHAACIGHQFTSETLALVTGRTAEEVEESLKDAVKDGLIHAVHTGRNSVTPVTTYKFLHDRVYQALYSLLSDYRKQEIHLQIGRLLEHHYADASAQEENTFEIVNQLNLGAPLIGSREEKERLAALNLKACRKAKESSAYDTGLKYALCGYRLLESDHWERQYELAYALQLEKAELEYLSGQFEEAKHSFAAALLHARTKLEKAEAYNLMMVLFTNLGEHEEALRIGLKGLKLLGIHIRPNTGKASIVWEMLKSQARKGTRSIDDLIDIPVMTDPNHKAVMQFLVNLIPPAYYINSELYIYLMLRMFNYSLVHGHAEGSAFAYTTYGVIMSSLLGRLNSGLAYGRLGVKLSDSFNHLPIKCKVYFGAGAFTSHVKEHIETNVELLRKAYQFGEESGDFVYAGYSITFSFFLRLFRGDHLSDVFKETEHYQNFIYKAQDRDTIMILTVLQRYMQNMRNQAFSHTSDETRSERFMSAEEIEQLSRFTNNAIIHTYYVMQGQTFYMFNRLDEARKLLEEAETVLSTIFGMMHVHLHHFHYGMVLAGLYDQAAPAERKRLRDRIQFSIRFMDKWARHSPDNFLHLKLLLEAEWYRITDKRALAEEKYDQAIHYAGKGRFVQYEAMASECAAKHYLQAGKLKIARSYLLEARSLYAKWGAERKVTDLDEKYPYLVTRGQAAEASIDLSCVVKASQAVSNETVLQQMLDSIMTIVLENAGAEKGMLVLERDRRLWIDAEKTANAPFAAMQIMPLEDCRDAAVTVIQYAARTGETVLLQDAVLSELFSKDAYIQTKRPKSILCVPICRFNKLVGALYLENNLATHVFQEERVETLKLLASEIAVLIENAKLYDYLESKDYKLQLLEEQEKNIRLQLDEKERWAQSSEATMLNIRKSQHELINNVQTVHALLMINKYDLAKDYISVWCKEIVQQSVIGSVKFPILAVVLNQLSLTCVSKKIDLQVSGNLDCAFDQLTLPINYFSSVMHNLLKNAVEAIPQDDLLRTVRLTIQEHEDHYRLTVYNTGSYISAEERNRIFDKGFSTKSEQANSGLGLHLAHNYLQHYGGFMECESTLDHGTSFIVYLPKRATEAVGRADRLPLDASSS
ncbi:AAA family ATPase [Paenibacillus sp. tmac-D7]|uniref:AAA family ATPase n=1 Tax=Paenibacillus sp. tmac-D7 TaxID=2591462 RepID=UPI00215B2185|nr:AAA family ATPase [Paenibacillus sp. tmac-D7]